VPFPGATSYRKALTLAQDFTGLASVYLCVYIRQTVASQGLNHSRTANQLRPGRHGLSRSFVARNQRERIIAAVGEATVAHGYGAMTVQDICDGAGVSRRTFYELFHNKHEAFLAAYEEVAGRLLATFKAAFKANPTFETRMIAGLQVFLEVLAATPTFARMCIVEVMAAGPDAVERRSAWMSEFARLFDDNARALLGSAAPSPLVSETVVGGILEAVYRRLAAGETAELPGLLADLVEWTLRLYLGEKVAAAHRARIDGPSQLAAG